MATEKIPAETRTEFGKGAARRIRRDNKIPAVVYGHGNDTIHVTLPGHDTMMALKHGGSNALLELEIEGEAQLALTKAVQIDPIRRVIEHIDFVAVRRGEKVTVDVRVQLVGDAASETAGRHREHHGPDRGRGDPHPREHRGLDRGAARRHPDPGRPARAARGLHPARRPRDADRQHHRAAERGGPRGRARGGRGRGRHRARGVRRRHRGRRGRGRRGWRVRRGRRGCRRGRRLRGVTRAAGRPAPSPGSSSGLGNPGPAYAGHRHNVGYLVADELVRRLGAPFKAHKASRAEVAEGRLGVPGTPGPRLVVIRPRCYMNEVGGPTKALLSFYKVGPERLVAVHDELDIPFDTMRVKFGGGDNGHNGLRSIRASLGTGDFFRVRVGIGRPPGRQDPADFVLSNYSSDRAQGAAVPGGPRRGRRRVAADARAGRDPAAVQQLARSHEPARASRSRGPCPPRPAARTPRAWPGSTSPGCARSPRRPR